MTDMSTPAQEPIRRHRYTVDDYYRMGEAGILREDDRVELIEGEIVDMTPIGSAHASAVARLQRMLERAAGDNAVVWIQNPVRLGSYSEPEPDVALVEPRADFYSTAHPTSADVLLIIEVADASLRYDRDIKIPLYARHGIPEVWLVDLESRCITRFSRPNAQAFGHVEELSPLDSVPLPGLEGINVDLSSLVE